MHMLALFLDDNTVNPQMMPGFIAAALGFYAVFYLIQAAVFIIPSWFISKKAGFSPWLSMLCLFPLTGVVFFYIIAFAEWKTAPTTTAVAWQPPPPPAPPAV